MTEAIAESIKARSLGTAMTQDNSYEMITIAVEPYEQESQS